MIELVNDLVIRVIKYNYVLMVDKHKVDKHGQPVYEIISYHGTLKAALNGALEYLNRKSLEDGTFTLKEAIQKINENHDLMVKLYERIYERILEEL